MADTGDHDLIVRVATGGRNVSSYVGRLPNGHKIPGGARPIEHVAIFLSSIAGAAMLALAFHWNVLTALVFGAGVGCCGAAALKAIPYDESVSPVNAFYRIITLIANRRPIVVAGDDRDEIDEEELASTILHAEEISH